MSAPARLRPRRSLSWRVLWVTLAVMALVELLLFAPAMQRERRAWLDGRLNAALIAVQALPVATAAGRVLSDPAERTAREQLLKLAGVRSVRLQEPGRPMVVLAPTGVVQAPVLRDLRRESPWEGALAALAGLVSRTDRLLLVIAPSPQRPQAILSVVLGEGEWNAHLRDVAAGVLLHGLAVALPTGALVLLLLHLLLVWPMRRLTAAIAAFRADPEHNVPAEAADAAHGSGEIALAGAELAAMQRELRAALWRNARLAALGTAVAKVTHDLRGILSPALLTAERLQGYDDPKVQRAGDTLARTVERATDLVRTTLAFARDVPPPPARETLALRPLAEEAAEQVRALVPSVSIEVGAADDIRLHADRTGLLRVLANLLRNAAEAGASRIFVNAHLEPEAVVVTVADNGGGLPDSVRDNLFRPFVTSGKPGGTGLGLAISRDLLRAQGGDIALARTGAEGTEFRLTLPRVG